MTQKVTISSEFIVEAMQSQTVRDALHARGRRIYAAASALDADNEFGIAHTDGTRPGGRPYSRVSADADQEWGTTYQDRRRILGTARDA